MTRDGDGRGPDDPGAADGGGRAKRAVLAFERRFDAFRARFARRDRVGGAVIVEPYRGYGGADAVRVRGRVLVRPDAGEVRAGAGALANLRAAWRRFESDEVPGARVRVAVGPAAAGEGAVPGEALAVADEEGHVDVVVAAPEPLAPGWTPVRFTLVDPAPDEGEPHAFHGEARVVDPAAPFGVISDMDDTVLVTGATRLTSVLRRTLFENAHDRLPFPGVATLYQGFEAAGAPTFYVSSSPWNLHAALTTFLELNQVPRGPLALRDWGLSDTTSRGHAGHKAGEIEAILDVAPELRFVLVGDSGQEDPEIYADLARRRPGRVAGVLIRHVGNDARAREVEALAATLHEEGRPFALVADSAAAARIARAAGWIDDAACAATEAACRDAPAGPPT